VAGLGHTNAARRRWKLHFRRLCNDLISELAISESPLPGNQAKRRAVGWVLQKEGLFEHKDSVCTYNKGAVISYGQAGQAGAPWNGADKAKYGWHHLTRRKRRAYYRFAAKGRERPTEERTYSLCRLPELKRLAMIGQPDRCLKGLDKLNKLESLSLLSNIMTDRGLENLSAMTNLRQLDLNGGQLTPQGVAKLRAALPNLRIQSAQ
jgi:hypothetical protein